MFSRILSFFKPAVSPVSSYYEKCLSQADVMIKSGQIVEAKKFMFGAMSRDEEACKWADFAAKEFAVNPELKDAEPLRRFLQELPYNKDATNYSKLTSELKKLK